LITTTNECATKATYFVDYENVAEHGLRGIEKLGRDDTVFIFYTNICNKLPMSCLAGNTANVRTVEAMPGKQALDIQLSSFLGHSIKKNAESFYIVSRDTDFDKVINFWNQQGYENLSRITSFEAKDNPEYEEEIPALDENVKQVINSVIKKYESADDKKTRIHGELVQIFGADQGKRFYDIIRSDL